MLPLYIDCKAKQSKAKQSKAKQSSGSALNLTCVGRQDHTAFHTSPQPKRALARIFPRAASGFTLIELIVVIVILGILSATALPKFIDMKRQARIATIHGIAGGLRSAVALSQAAFIVKKPDPGLLVKGTPGVSQNQGRIPEWLDLGTGVQIGVWTDINELVFQAPPETPFSYISTGVPNANSTGIGRLMGCVVAHRETGYGTSAVVNYDCGGNRALIKESNSQIESIKSAALFFPPDASKEEIKTTSSHNNSVLLTGKDNPFVPRCVVVYLPPFSERDSLWASDMDYNQPSFDIFEYTLGC